MPTEIDKIAVDEVILFAENDYDLYQKLINIYLPNLQKKVAKGIYDKEKAIKLMEYYYSNYIRPEMKKPSKYGWDPKLNPKERKMVATYFRDYLWVEFLSKVKKNKPRKSSRIKPKKSIKKRK